MSHISSSSSSFSPYSNSTSFTSLILLILSILFILIFHLVELSLGAVILTNNQNNNNNVRVNGHGHFLSENGKNGQNETKWKSGQKKSKRSLQDPFNSNSNNSNTSNSKQRQKRDFFNNYDDYDDPRKFYCKRYELEVYPWEIGLPVPPNKFHAPQKIDLGYCSGICPYPLQSGDLNFTNHSFFIDQYRARNLMVAPINLPYASCVPVSYKDVELIFELDPDPEEYEEEVSNDISHYENEYKINLTASISAGENFTSTISASAGEKFTLSGNKISPVPPSPSAIFTKRIFKQISVQSCGCR